MSHQRLKELGSCDCFRNPISNVPRVGVGASGVQEDP